MKKALAIILILALCFTLLAACKSTGPSTESPAGNTPGSETPTSGETVKLTIWHEVDATIADTLQQQLNDIPGVEVKLERKEQMSDALKLVGNDPNSAPDMYFWAHDKIGVFAEMGILTPVTDIISASDMTDLLPMSIDAATYKGSQYQLPVYFETLLFMYNKDLMATPPATTDELLATMKAETANGEYVFVEQHSTAYYAAAWIQGYGGYIINENSEPGLDSAATIDSCNYHKKFIPFMPSDGEYNTVTTLFTEGKAQSTIGGPWMVPGLKDAGMNLGIAAMPVLPNGNPLTPFSGIQGVCVLKHAGEGKTDAVAKVLLALLRPETGIALAKAASCAPVNQLAYEDTEVAANEMIMAMRETAANVVPMPNVPEMDVMWSVTDTLLAAINKNNADVQTECASAQAKALEQIAAMR